MSTQNALAKTLKALHKPGNPLILANVWDAITAKAVASLPETKALATASYAVALAAGVEDPELTLDTNIRAVEGIAKIAKQFNKPLTADFQDGYGNRLEEGVKKLIGLGVVGCNIEDYDGEKNGLWSVEEAVGRIERVLKVANDAGVPDFVVNARTDALVTGLSIDEAITRGKAYLNAGATSAFIWGGRARPGMRTEEVQKAAKELDGRLNVSMVRVRPGGLNVKELSEIGVSRISVGPQLMMRTVGSIAEEAKRMYAGEEVKESVV
ncbi:PEP phosphonomutase-like protein [Byssothecium circinans]|uniref:PEP phosphonomutase-like protein n=1 Tax=Byssothecium circinans TaxID=147558 RepID=A0A6A5TVM0_9PLEO|nr:PEP phosphonomutase-like protein [Byssothecium circinans]